MENCLWKAVVRATTIPRALSIPTPEKAKCHPEEWHKCLRMSGLPGLGPKQGDCGLRLYGGIIFPVQRACFP